MAVYLDYNATAPLRPEALARMQELLAVPANPSSVHRFGREAKKYLENARKIIADAISAWPAELLFTATGTEANTTALRGFPGRRLLVSAVEHSSVLKVVRGEELGVIKNHSPLTTHSSHLTTSYIPVLPSGLLDLAALDTLLATGQPALVSVMLANNETGVIQPIREVADICKKYGALLHCDAVQALGKIPVDFGTLGCDLMTLSAHKCGGPVGASALVVRRDLPFQALLTGGGQELGRRAGTENLPAIAGFAAAVEAFDFGQMKRLRGWMDRMERKITSPGRGGVAEHSDAGGGESVYALTPSPTLPPTGGGGIIFGSSAPRLPNTSCIAMPGVGNEVQLMDFDLKGFAVSAGSACSSGRIEVSHVLRAMGVAENLASCAIRVSGGWQTSENDLILFTETWKTTRERLVNLRKMG